MNYEDLLVIGFMLLHGAAFLSVIRWLGYFMMARNQLGDAREQTKEKERKARLPALIFAVLLYSVTSSPRRAARALAGGNMSNRRARRP